jgi:hypothetical protein
LFGGGLIFSSDNHLLVIHLSMDVTGPFLGYTTPRKGFLPMIAPTINRLAIQDFERARQRVFWRDLFSLFTLKPNHPLSLDQIRRSLPLKRQHYRGLQTILLNQIVGSLGRTGDFDRAFFPRQERTRDRWIRIDQAHYQSLSLPPVELIKIGDMYFVSDGNHRVSVARSRGQEFIEAYVTEIELEAPAEYSEKCFEAARC